MNNVEFSWQTMCCCAIFYKRSFWKCEAGINRWATVRCVSGGSLKNPLLVNKNTIAGYSSDGYTTPNNYIQKLKISLVGTRLLLRATYQHLSQFKAEQLKKINHIYIGDFFFMKKSRGLHEINRGGHETREFYYKTCCCFVCQFFQKFFYKLHFYKACVDIDKFK
jgi:hypothetical protein